MKSKNIVCLRNHVEWACSLEKWFIGCIKFYSVSSILKKLRTNRGVNTKRWKQPYKKFVEIYNNQIATMMCANKKHKIGHWIGQVLEAFDEYFQVEIREEEEEEDEEEEEEEQHASTTYWRNQGVCTTKK